jgi:hypothetical protein
MTLVIGRTVATILASTIAGGPTANPTQVSPARAEVPAVRLETFSLERIAHLLERDSPRLLAPQTPAGPSKFHPHERRQQLLHGSLQGSGGTRIGRKVAGAILLAAGVAMIRVGADRYQRAKQQLQQCDAFEEGVAGCLDPYERQLRVGEVIGSVGASAAIVGTVLLLR